MMKPQKGMLISPVKDCHWDNHLLSLRKDFSKARRISISVPVKHFQMLRPGDVKYRDINADGIIDAFDQIL